jgi:hypothetical protein
MCSKISSTIVAVKTYGSYRSRFGSTTLILTSDVDPYPDPDPHVFGPPGSGFTSQRYGSGSGSSYHHAIVRKPLNPIFCNSF